jgi:hypothetical protein
MLLFAGAERAAPLDLMVVQNRREQGDGGSQRTSTSESYRLPLRATALHRKELYSRALQRTPALPLELWELAELEASVRRDSPVMPVMW